MEESGSRPSYGSPQVLYEGINVKRTQQTRGFCFTENSSSTCKLTPWRCTTWPRGVDLPNAVQGFLLKPMAAGDLRQVKIPSLQYKLALTGTSDIANLTTGTSACWIEKWNLFLTSRRITSTSTRIVLHIANRAGKEQENTQGRHSTINSFKDWTTATIQLLQNSAKKLEL